MAIAAAGGWYLRQADVTAAFLHADLREEICIQLPEIIRDKLPGKCGVLQKTLYGLK